MPRARRSLGLAVLLSCSPAFAQGFGGGDPELELDADACVVEVDGKMVPCSAVLEDEAEEPAAPPIRAPRSEPIAAPPEAEPERKPFAPRSPLAEALEAQREGLEVPPLVRAREAVDALAARLLALEDKGAAMRSQDPVRAELELERAVLEDIEKRAEARMLGCARQKDNKWAHRYDRGLQTTRMTPAGPVKTKPRGGAMLDLPGCERVNFVDDQLIATVRRIHEIDRVLKTRRWRYGEGDEERALRDEKKKLQATLSEGLPRLKPWNRDPEALQKMYITRPD